MDDDEYEKMIAQDKYNDIQTAFAFDVCGDTDGEELEKKRIILDNIGNKVKVKQFINMLSDKNLLSRWKDFYNTYDENGTTKTDTTRSEKLLEIINREGLPKHLRMLEETKHSQSLASDGGRRKRKRSTRRKKRRGKKTRKYRRKY
jgi:hypothetical protein